MEDKALDELELHQKVISTDQNSPLELIREKEMEISGKVLQAKREADEIIAEARRQAAERIAKAEQEGAVVGEERKQRVQEEAKAEAERAVESAGNEAAELQQRVARNKDEAIKLVLASVSRV